MNGADPDLLTAAALCGAKNRRGLPCRCPAMRGKKRCRLHGGKSPGAPKGRGNGNYRHGGEAGEVKALRRMVREIVRGAIR